jgi:16S rRNA (guanine966-N2)-methyltransferase
MFLRHNVRNALQNGRPLMSGARNSVRIIGGRWRGRRVRFASLPGLRPSPDRVRETLFNWLQAEVPGARCLDLFAGSGALGLEALSRGAARVVFVDEAAAVTRPLAALLVELDAGSVASVVRADAFTYLKGKGTPCDLVFLDPPFDRDCLPELFTLLEQQGWLAPEAWIYAERAAHRGPPACPAGWTLWRQGRAGEVGYYLMRRGRIAPSPDTNDSPPDPS